MQILRLVAVLLIASAAVVTGQPGEPGQSTAIIQAARQGDAYAQGVLAGVYRRGEWGTIDYRSSLSWAQQAAEQGDPLGLYNLAVLYETGMGIEPDSLMAADLYRRAEEPLRELARAGDPRGQVNLGYLLENEEDPDCLREAVGWYRQAAVAGDARAQFILGYKYYHGWGLGPDTLEAVSWFTRSAEQDYPAAQHFLGNLYYGGRGVNRDTDLAIRFFRQAEAFRSNSEQVATDSSSYSYNGIVYPGDKVIGGLLPPLFRLEISEGSCGEACLWSVINSGDFQLSQLEVNLLGGNPGRGLQTNELHLTLDICEITYSDRMNRSYLRYALSYFNPVRHFVSPTAKYHEFLYNVVIENVRQGNPVILGVKIYPDLHYFWDCDHFILVVGYNADSAELIYNSFNQRGRIAVEKLLDNRSGYSLLNRYNFTNCIILKDFGR